jgi:hypothetical protein
MRTAFFKFIDSVNDKIDASIDKLEKKVDTAMCDKNHREISTDADELWNRVNHHLHDEKTGRVVLP